MYFALHTRSGLVVNISALECRVKGLNPAQVMCLCLFYDRVNVAPFHGSAYSKQKNQRLGQ